MNLLARIHTGLCRIDLTATVCLMKPLQHRPRTPISQFSSWPGKVLAKVFTFHNSTRTLIWNTFCSFHGAKFTPVSFQNFMVCFFKVTCASFKFFMITNYQFSRSHISFFHGNRCIISRVHAITTFATHKLKSGITPIAQI
jgi:hypothetical protein